MRSDDRLSKYWSLPETQGYNWGKQLSLFTFNEPMIEYLVYTWDKYIVREHRSDRELLFLKEVCINSQENVMNNIYQT